MAKKRRRPRRSVSAFDLDGSLMREQLLILLFREFFELGIFSKDVEVTFRHAFNEHRYRRIEFHEFDQTLVRLFNDRIRGKHVEDMRSAAKRVADKHRDWLYTFSKELLSTVRKTHNCITVTGALHEVVSELAPYWGFEHIYASQLEIRRGKYTGRELRLPVLDKKAALLAHVEKHRGSVTLKGSIGIGDTRSDIPLLSTVDNPIAFNPTDTLATEAERLGWPIVVERKDCIYVLHAKGGARFHIDEVAKAVRHVLDIGEARARRGARRHR